MGIPLGREDARNSKPYLVTASYNRIPVIIQMSCMEMRAPTISILWYPKLCLGVASQPAIHRANRLMAKPAQSQLASG